MTERGPKKGQTLALDFSAPPAPSPPVPEPDSLAPAQVESLEPPPAESEKFEEPRVFTVAQVGRILGRALDRSFPKAIWIEGEVTGARPAASGHIYLCLKDEEEEAMVDVVLYRSALTPRARTLIKDGARLKVRAKPAYFAPRGRLQLIADRVEPTGQGALLEAIEKLKAKLMAEGLFDREKKRALPHEPRIVGVVSSRSGAVIHDIVKVSFRRGGAHILLAPAQVQGLGSAESIRRGLAALQRIEEVDVIIIARGGGSSDDLMAFHDEQLVRDVARCRVPVVSAVGHEVDFTLVDFAADARASTPSQAAEMVVPDSAHLRRLLEERSQRLRRAMHARIAEDRVSAERLANAFRDPRMLIATAQQRIDDAVTRMNRVVSRQIDRERQTQSRIATRLSAAHPRARIAKDRAKLLASSTELKEHFRARIVEQRNELADLTGALREDFTARMTDGRGELATLAARLDAMSPLAVLSRGYAIATKKNGRAVRDPSEVETGDLLAIRVAHGSFEVEVKK